MIVSGSAPDIPQELDRSLKLAPDGQGLNPGDSNRDEHE